MSMYTHSIEYDFIEYDLIQRHHTQNINTQKRYICI